MPKNKKKKIDNNPLTIKIGETIIEGYRVKQKIKSPPIFVDGVELVSGETIRFDIPRKIEKGEIEENGIYICSLQKFKKKKD